MTRDWLTVARDRIAGVLAMPLAAIPASARHELAMAQDALARAREQAQRRARRARAVVKPRRKKRGR